MCQACARLNEVVQTAASFAVFFLRSVASTDRAKELSFATAVESTDRSLTHTAPGRTCSPSDGVGASCLRSVASATNA